jgi:hypothetical protein
MRLLPLFIAVKQTHDLRQLAYRALEHYRQLPPEEQERLRGEADRVGALASELAGVTAHTVRSAPSSRPTSAPASGREAKVIAAELRDALARFTDSMAQEAAAVVKTESVVASFAVKALGLGARRLDRSGTALSLPRHATDEREAREPADDAAAAEPPAALRVHARTSPPARSLADELDKLDALRRRGVLTDAEFQSQKRALLGG